MMSQLTMKRYIAGFPAVMPRARALELEISIGTGFHGKWYRSQKEHWLGWLEVQACKAELRGQSAASSSASKVWSGLKCSPMMFWLAEAIGLPNRTLDAAEKAAKRAALVNPMDGNPHGKYMREVLPWSLIEPAFLVAEPNVDLNEAYVLSASAFDRLKRKRSEFRRLVSQVDALRSDGTREQ